MKKIMLSILVLLLMSSSIEANAPFKLNAGKNQTIQLNQAITLNGKVKGNIENIEYYQWTERNKILKNSLGDEILYEKAIYAENDYKPTSIGEHLLHFQAITLDGKMVEDTLLVIVQKNNNDLIIEAGANKNIGLDDSILLEGLIKKGTKKNNIYSWLENGKPLLNTFGDEIVYYNYDDRENAYKPTSQGKHVLVFQVETETGKIFTDTLLLTVKGGENEKPITLEKLKGMINRGEDVRYVNTSKITDMSNLFYNKRGFNQNISRWDVSNVTNMSNMFTYAVRFTGGINGWDVSNVTDMSNMFKGTKKYNSNLNQWNVSKVRNMSAMFYDAVKFNQPLNTWDTSSLTNASNMFNTAEAFNQPLNNWNTSKVLNMERMFACTQIHYSHLGQKIIPHCYFNQSLNNWNVANVINHKDIFKGKKIEMEEKNKPKF